MVDVCYVVRLVLVIPIGYGFRYRAWKIESQLREGNTKAMNNLHESVSEIELGIESLQCCK
jgi:hypothetical protein